MAADIEGVLGPLCHFPEEWTRKYELDCWNDQELEGGSVSDNRDAEVRHPSLVGGNSKRLWSALFHL